MVTMTMICLATALGAHVGSAAATEPVDAPIAPHVRALSDSARELLSDAIGRSPTIARLVQRLQAQKIFVLLETRVDPSVPTAETSLLAATEAGRYLYVVLNPQLSRNRRMELLGHELQHAVEIAQAESVRDGRSLREYYAVHGRALTSSGNRTQSYETDAAQTIERQVRRELALGLGSGQI